VRQRGQSKIRVRQPASPPLIILAYNTPAHPLIARKDKVYTITKFGLLYDLNEADNIYCSTKASISHIALRAWRNVLTFRGLVMGGKAEQIVTTVLLVDDEHDVREMLGDVLVAFGYKVHTASSGETALELLKENPVDLVLCDLCLPGMTGIQFTSALYRMHPQLPVVLITAYGDIESSRAALQAGAADFITKPLEMTTLPFILENNIQRKRLEIQRLQDERADVLFKAIKAMAAAIDAKSHFTGKHSARMADLCLEIGAEMGLSQERLNTLELAAHIHDVGKIGTPDSVLDKPGKLTDEEWVDILKHPSMGADFLTGIDELAEVASIVRHHHEHIDGSGYPDGLKGKAIPELARILAVADAFEAMTSDRPYREAISISEALKELRAHAGTQFDAAVVEAMVRVADRINSNAPQKRAA